MSSSLSFIPHLVGRSLIDGQSVIDGGLPFHGYAPQDGRRLEPEFLSAILADVDRAVAGALDAAAIFGSSSGVMRGRLLRSIADGIDAASATLIERAHLETALPRPRLTGEVARTSGQLRLFAESQRRVRG